MMKQGTLREKERSRSQDLRQCWQEGGLFLMEGALGERLKHEFHLTFNKHIAMAELVCRKEGRDALLHLWRQYLHIAERYSFPFLATTPTRRFNQERAVQAYGKENAKICSLFAENMELLKIVQAEADNLGVSMFAGALLGCRGDAYTGEGCFSACEAERFHQWETCAFAEAGADFLYAALMPALPEALGMARAMANTGLPAIMSFTLRADGCLADGTPLHTAIEIIDGEVSPRPLCYMSNCVHPDVVREALSHPCNKTPAVRSRFLGIQANAARLSFEQLEQARKTYQTPPEELAQGMLRLRKDFNLRLFGGCCGTTDTHMEAIAAAIKGTWEGLEAERKLVYPEKPLHQENI